eukprot:7466822-Lingulodinium_polyedra.AAC.1
MLARRWRFPLHINEAELRVAVNWARVLGLARDVERSEVLGLSDNFVATSAMTKGRSPVKGINDQCRVKAACEAA